MSARRTKKPARADVREGPNPAQGPNTALRSGGTLSKLAEVSLYRQPFRELTRGLLRDAFGRYPFDTPGPIVEIGAGDGQLRELLPPELGARVVHTEPLAEPRRLLLARYPEAKVVNAAAEALPFEAGSVAGVLGCCVLDVVNDLERVAEELVRVLAPGAHLLHLLDLSADLSEPLMTLKRLDLVPLPNVFGIPCASAWPEDIFAVPRGQLALMLPILKRAGRSSQAPLQRYLEAYGREPFDVAHAVALFNGLGATPSARANLLHLFQLVLALATPAERGALAQFQGRALSSAQHFARRLERELGKTLQIEFSGIVTNRQLSERSASAAELRHTGYLSLCVGQRREQSRPPAILLVPQAVPAAEDQLLTEQGIFVFVARKAETS